MSEKYYNHFIEIMTSTMNDAIIRNISLQANAKVLEEIITEQKIKINELEFNSNGSINNLTNELETTKNKIYILQSELNSLNSLKSEYESIKSKAQHVDSLREELYNARKDYDILKEQHIKEIEKTISNYESKINVLSSKSNSKVNIITPFIKEKNQTKLTTNSQKNSSSLKDGGSF